MNGSNYANVQTLIAIDNPLLRKGLKEAFKHAGFAKMVDASTPEHLTQVLGETEVDLIVMTAEIKDSFVGSVISDMRNGKIGQHPFALVILLLAAADQDFVGKVINCGPDDMLLMPVAPTQLLSRVETLSRNRKPFVVTQDFTGPDRRKAKRDGQSAPMIEVPNPLSARVNNVSPEVLQRQIHGAVRHLNLQKLERYIVQIAWLNDALGNLLNATPVDTVKRGTYVDRVLQISDDLPSRTAGALSTGSPLLAGLSGAARAILETTRQDAPACLARLGQASSSVIGEIKRLLLTQRPVGS